MSRENKKEKKKEAIFFYKLKIKKGREKNKPGNRKP